MLLAVKKINWYFTRLSVMKPAEIIHRIDEIICLQRIKYSRQSKHQWHDYFIKNCSEYRFVKSSQKLLPELKWNWSYTDIEQHKLLNGEISVFGFQLNSANDDECWNFSIDTGNYWQKKYFSRINYREGNSTGDIRIAWEASRLQHFLILANIARDKNNLESHQAFELLLEQFNSWMKGNQPYIGINYISVMECALRIISLTHAFDMLRWQLQVRDDVWPLLVKLIVNHADLIYNRLSLHSSAGNHTIAECAGLVYAGVLLNEHSSANKWKLKGLELLVVEVKRQILPDGGGLEQSHWYLLFILDLIGLVIELLKYHKHVIPVEIIRGFNRGRTFINSFATSAKLLPGIGDADNGYALSPYLAITWNNIYTVERLKIFDDSGYTLFKGKGVKPVNLTFDHGSLGMTPSCGHGHADALSVLLNIGDENIFIDSGTYRYGCNDKWRQYFRGTHAHNTVVVDGDDQANQGSTFMWKNDYKACLERWSDDDDQVRLLASHDGYNRVGVIHRRAISIKEGDYILICDFLNGVGEHELELNWHIPKVHDWQDDNTMILSAALPISMDVVGGVIDCFSGLDDPVIGWRSNNYGDKESIMTVQCRYAGKLPHMFVTTVKLTTNCDKQEINNEIQELKKWNIQ